MNTKGEQIAFATIVLYNSQDSVMQGVLSDSMGNYHIHGDFEDGLYNVKISHVGTQNSISPIEIKKGTSEYEQNIVLNEHETLENVVVTGRAPTIKQFADRIEVAVNSDVLNIGSSALDALQRSPGVSVDRQEGTVRLMGKDVIILIDGRDTKMAVSDILAMLETMPADNIVTFDLITTPPAQYEAEGKGGVINITMKRYDNEGLNASISQSFGYSEFWKYRGGGNVYYSKKKLSLYGGVNYVNEKFFSKTTESFLRDSQQTISTIERERNNPALTYRAGMDYALNAKNNAGCTVDGFFKPQNTYMGKSESQFFTHAQSDSVIQSTYSIPSVSNNIHSNIYYTHKFSETSSLNADFDYLHEYFSEKGNYVAHTFDRSQNVIGNWSLHNPSQSEVNVWAFRSDYSKKMRENAQFEAGLKSSIVRIDYKGEYLFTQNAMQLSRSSIFDYAEQNHALYAAWADKLGQKFNYKVGLRSELTHTIADSETATGIIDSSYIKLFPSAFLMYTPAEKHTFKLAYNKRITRPSYRALNPYEYYSSQTSIIAGSPQLQPFITHEIELGHTYNNWLTTNVFYQYNRNEFSQIIKRSESNPNTVIYVHENVGTGQGGGIFSGGYKQLLQCWGVYAEVVTYYAYTDFVIVGKREQKQQFFVGSYLSTQFFLPKETKLELAGYAQSPENSGFYERQAFYHLRFNAAKTFGKEHNCTVTLRINDLLNTDKRHSIGYSDGMNIDIKNVYDSRQVWVSALWNIGKNKQNDTKKQNVIEEVQKRM
ncbi:MAG: TonB-dependent receptor [Bacteroidales bacterium]|nr:TonB-dependent receptor [Bacteroidales bacterium]